MRKVFIAAITAGFILPIVIITISNNVNHKDAQNIILAENHIVIEDLTLSRVSNKDNGYALLKAGSAYMDRTKDTIVLQDTALEYKDNHTSFTSRADHGWLMLNKSLITKGKIAGQWNGMGYRMDDNGTFEYNFVDKKGIFKDNITLEQMGSSIRAFALDFDSNAQTVYFSGGVEMFFTGEKI